MNNSCWWYLWTFDSITKGTTRCFRKFSVMIMVFNVTFYNISLISWRLYISFGEDNILVTFYNISVISWRLYISFGEDNILVLIYYHMLIYILISLFLSISLTMIFFTNFANSIFFIYLVVFPCQLFGLSIFWLWAYLVTVIPETRRAH